MNAVTKIAPDVEVRVTILNARDSYGSRTVVSEGAVALATWLSIHDGSTRADGLISFMGGIANVTRMIADDLMPGNEWGEELGRLTDGVVTPSLWRRRYAGAIELAEQAISGKSASAIIVDDPIATPTGLLCEVMGRPGEVQAGPLYVAIADPLTPNAFVVTGFGHATVFDAPRANAMRAALADGMRQIGARFDVTGAAQAG